MILDPSGSSSVYLTMKSEGGVVNRFLTDTLILHYSLWHTGPPECFLHTGYSQYIVQSNERM